MIFRYFCNIFVPRSEEPPLTITNNKIRDQVKFKTFLDNSVDVTKMIRLKFESIKIKGKETADNNFKFDENGREFSKRVENTLRKGEIACYEQFLLFVTSNFSFSHSVFEKKKKIVLQTRKNKGLFGI